jgi:hypothetical protein
MKKTTEISSASVACQTGRFAVTRPNLSSQFQKTISLTMAFTLSLLLCLTATKEVKAQTPTPAYISLNADQLDQLVAPIALDPDPLVAQILTASTYPDQVGAADTWSNQNISLPADQRASGADAMPWDPAIKGLVAFPNVLDNLAKNAAWTAQLGNAYFNQPDDVMNAIQSLRTQAQQANVLVTTPQERVVVTAGVIAVVPVNPALVYVPYYNPWRVWGALFVAYPGYVVTPAPMGVVAVAGIAFEPPVAIVAYGVFGWGFAAWTPAWTSGAVIFNHSTYISHSVTVINHGHFGGHDAGAFEHGGHGVPNGYHASAHAGAAGRNAALHTQAGTHARTTATSHGYSSHTASQAHSGYGSSSRSNSTHSQSSHASNSYSRSTRTSQAHSSQSARTGRHAQAHSSAGMNHPQARTSRSLGMNRSAPRSTRSAGMNSHSQARASRASGTSSRSMLSPGVGNRAQTRTVASHQSMGARSAGGRSRMGRRR